MGRVAAIAGGLLGVLAFVAGAQAADPPRSWPKPYEEILPEIKYRELASGWYGRLDIGYRWYSGGGPSFAGATQEDYSTGFNGTVGFGLKYHWFRTDITYDRGTPTRVGITTITATPQPQYGARIRPETLLANVYFDLGSWWGFTPYVGGGAGWARLTSTSYVDTANTGFVYGKGKANNFAWAAMGGVAYQLSSRWMIDVGYRYLSFGDAVATDMTNYTAGSLTPYFKNITAHETRIGIRFLMD